MKIGSFSFGSTTDFVPVLEHSKLIGELRAKNEGLEAVFAVVDQTSAIIEFDLKGNVLACNKNFLAAMDYSFDELKGRHHRMFVEEHFANSRDYQAFWERLRSGECVQGEFKGLGKNRKVVWFQASYAPVFSKEGNCYKFIKIASDITANKERSLNDKAQLDAVNKAQAILELLPDGTISAANDNFLQLYGYGSIEIVGKNHRFLLSAVEAESYEYNKLWNSLRSGDSLQSQFKQYDKGGREFWISATFNPVSDDAGKVVRILKYCSDITRQIQTNERAQIVGTTLSSNVIEMAKAIDEISRNVAMTAMLAKTAEDNTGEASAIVEELKTGSSTIGKVVQVIQELAEQTNLLALNATIEAARAGDSGRGFAVVASEVKALATQTATATSSIDDTVRNIQRNIDEVVQAIRGITQRITEVSQNTNGIAASVEEQSVIMNGLSKTAEQLSHISH